MAIIRSIIVVLFVICGLCPSFATAQNVYEVRTSSDDYVVIGTHERGATLMEVVALARRLTGNEALTSEDVLANASHARRYICRVDGRQVYFGTDPSSDRCPENATRADGILRGTRYRVPRTHGAVLSPTIVRSRPVASATTTDLANANAHALEYMRELERVTVERDEARAALSEERGRVEEAETLVNRANDERDNALERVDALTQESEELSEENTELMEELGAARAAPVPAPAASAATLSMPFHGRPLWSVFLFVVILMIAFFLIALWPLRWAFRQPLIRQLSEMRATLRVWEMDLRKEGKNLSQEKKKTKSLFKRLTRLVRAVVYYRQDRETKDRALAAALKNVTELQAFRDRKDRIAENSLLLTELRDQEEPFLMAELLLQEAMEGLQAAQAREDAEGIRQHEELVRVYEENLKTLGDSTEIRARIAALNDELKKDLAEQCGLQHDVRPADERLGEWERMKRDHLRKAEAAKRTHEGLVTVIESQGIAALEEHAKRRRELENKDAALDGQYQAKVWLIASSKQELLSDLERERRLHSKTGQGLAASKQTMDEMRAQNDELDSLLRASFGDPTNYAKDLMARDQRIIELEEKCRAADIDPGMGPRLSAEFWADAPARVSSVPSNGAAHARVPTLGVAAPIGERPSSLPGASSPGNAINTALYRFLDTVEAMPPELRIIHCNEREARDWAFLFGQWKIAIVAPWDGAGQPRTTRDIPLRELGKTVKRFFPDWLESRGRRKTDPPGAPSPA